MCVPVCMYLGASSSCLSLCVDTRWTCGASPPGEREGGTGGASAVGSVPCGHPLPHEASGLAAL